jgi:ribosome recycling factor
MEEDIKEFIDSCKEDMEKSISYLKSEYQILRAGRANPHILDKITVDYYGTMTPINQMGNISVPEAKMLVINVWDQSQVKNIAKEIAKADLGVSPVEDGKIIRLIFPALTEERRREIVKAVKTLCENAKISIRTARRDCLDIFKQMKKDGDISEDEYTGAEREVQKLVDTFNSQADTLCSTKEKEIMEV